MRTACGYPSDGRTCQRWTRLFRPTLQVLFCHLRIISNQSRQVHRVINAGIVKIECQAVVLFDALLDFLQFLDFYAVTRLRHTVPQQDILVTVPPQRPDRIKYGFRAHRLVNVECRTASSNLGRGERLINSCGFATFPEWIRTGGGSDSENT